jgi:hypothetical protein
LKQDADVVGKGTTAFVDKIPFLNRYYLCRLQLAVQRHCLRLSLCHPRRGTNDLKME